MDEDLAGMDRADLINTVQQLRDAIRAHRDTTLHDLCWYQPELWGLLPEKTDPQPKLPSRERFLQGCAAFRDALERELPQAEIIDVEFTTDADGAARDA
jgi:hypothetical protein